MSEYINDFEVRKAILHLLGGDSTNFSNIYEVDLEILKIYEEGGGSSDGGKTKVAEIDIDNSCIVDSKWNANNIDVSLLTTLNYFFDKCSSLIEVDLSSWDVSNVTDMSYMFDSCKLLQSVDDLSNWNVGNVTDMRYMFYGCSSLQSVGDLSNWNVGNVTNMNSMFNSCSSLQSLDLSGWDTSKVTNMYNMFYNCSSLIELDLSGWDGSSVTNIGNFSYNSPILTYVGGKTIDEVINNNITIFNGIKKSKLNILQRTADRASARALINGLADITGETAYVLELYSDFKNKITTEDIAVATEKNWTISFLY